MTNYSCQYLHCINVYWKKPHRCNCVFHDTKTHAHTHTHTIILLQLVLVTTCPCTIIPFSLITTLHCSGYSRPAVESFLAKILRGLMADHSLTLLELTSKIRESESWLMNDSKGSHSALHMKGCDVCSLRACLWAAVSDCLLWVYHGTTYPFSCA